MIAFVAVLLLSSASSGACGYALSQRPAETPGAFDQRIKDCAVLSRAIALSLEDEDAGNAAATAEKAKFDAISRDLSRTAQSRATGALAQGGMMAELLMARGQKLAKEQALYRGDEVRHRALADFRARWSRECGTT